MELFAPMHLLLVLGIALLVFGPRKLPELGKGLGEAIRGFKNGVNADDAKPGPSSSDPADKSNRPSSPDIRS
jgi:sec-independent protein translocase protein TatA